MFLTLLQSPPSAVVVDTSDILGAFRRKPGLTSRDEEAIVAQLLKARQAKQTVVQKRKRAIEWKQLILAKINNATTEQELENVSTVPIESVEVTAAVLAEIERQKEAKRLELEIIRREAEIKAAEFQAQLKANEDAIYAKVQEQRAALEAAKQLHLRLLQRHQIAVEMARQEELRAFMEAQAAENEFVAFTNKRNQRIKRLKALMWLAKLDI